MITSAADPDGLVRAAVALFQRGRFEEAASTSRRALKLRPAHAGALNVLGVSLQAQGKHAKAAAVFDELTRRYPTSIGHWVNLGTALRAEGRHEDALAAYSRAGSLGEASPDFLYNVGLAHLDMGNYDAAYNLFRDARRKAPRDGEVGYQFAACCDATMRQDEAIAALEDWEKMQGLTTELLAKIALLLMNLGELRSAGRAAEQALRDPRPDAESVLRIIQVLERTNRVTEARAFLEELKSNAVSESLGTDLQLVEARLADREGRAEEAREHYLALLENTPESHLRHYHLFPLAKVLDKLGRFDEAFSALEEAHRSQLAYLKRTVPDATPRQGPPLRIVDFGCDAADVAAWDHEGAPPMEESPVFIVGFPRSGTTLLEQTLDAHPSLCSMDETRFLHEVIDRMVDDGVGYPAKLASVSRTLREELRQMYWNRVRRKVEVAPGQRLVDKNPMNLLALPAIGRLFPNSRILVAVRHPCDVILSCYMQHFRAPEFTMLCRDLPSLAAGYRRAFDFWYREAAILRPSVREVRYETLVNDFESQVRAIADFLGLPWNDAMLEPGEHARRKGFISTPSYSQVIQPVGSGSVGRWRSYEKHFGQVIPEIRPFLDRWGYSA